MSLLDEKNEINVNNIADLKSFTQPTNQREATIDWKAKVMEMMNILADTLPSPLVNKLW